jgi:hypothetical protein
VNFVKDEPLQCAVENKAPRHYAKIDGQDRTGEELMNNKVHE